MKAILALDTADRTAGAAVAVDGVVRSAMCAATPHRHSQQLLDLVEYALAGAGVQRADLDAVAVTRGPGSFTGLRVGIATAKGLAWALGIPLVGVPSLGVLARQARPFPGYLLPLLDARKRQVYAAVYAGTDGAQVVAEGAFDVATLVSRIPPGKEPVLALGSGLGAYGRQLRELLGERLWTADPPRWALSPGQVAVMGDALLADGGGAAPADLVPVYCRLSEAEERTRRVPG